MPVDKISMAPEYLMIFVSDPRAIDVPMQGEKRGIRATGECITIPCLYWNDGDTTVTMGSFAEVDQRRTADFDTVIETPSRRVVVTDVAMKQYAGQAVSNVKTRVRIWINHPTEPDEVVIAIGD